MSVSVLCEFAVTYRINMRCFTQNFNWYLPSPSPSSECRSTHITQGTGAHRHGHARVRTGKIVENIGIWLGELLNVNCRLQSAVTQDTHSHTRKILPWCFDCGTYSLLGTYYTIQTKGEEKKEHTILLIEYIENVWSVPRVSFFSCYFYRSDFLCFFFSIFTIKEFN